MYNISDDEIEFILDDIAKRGVETEDVRYNILDHVCCIIENEMPQGKDFYEFYKDTIARFYRKELREIEDETRELTTFKYYYAMKRTLKITGLISVLLIAIGSILKWQHLPGAGIMLFSGFIIFTLLFIPLNIIMKFRDDKEKYNRIVMTLGLSLTLTGTMGMLFKVMHWPYANMLFFGSLALFGLVFIPVYFFTRYRNPDTKFNAIIHSVFMFAAAGMMFMMINLKTSHHVTESVESMDEFQFDNVERFKVSNADLYASFDNENKDVTALKNSTAVLNEKIESIKRNLLASSNGTSEEEISKSVLESAKNPNDSDVIQKQFAASTGDLTYNSLKLAIDDYNRNLNGIDNSQFLSPINIEKLQMTNTILSVVLHELVDIQVQLLANENSYLCLQHGLMVQR